MAVQAPALSGYKNQLLGFSPVWLPIVHPPPVSSTGYTDAAAAVTFAVDTFRCCYPSQTLPPVLTFPNHDHDPQPLPFLWSFHGAHYDPFMSVTVAIPPTPSIDLFLKLQGESLRCAIHEQRKQQMGLLLEQVESMATAMVREKEEELAAARSKTKELEERLSRAEAEKGVWEMVAKEKEAMVVACDK